MRLLTALIAISLLVSCSNKNNSISQFRGTDRSGIYQETNLLKVWPDNGPDEVLFIDSLGQGYGSPGFADDMMYISGTSNDSAILFCFDLNGTLQWKTNYGYEWMSSFPGSRSAPTIVKDLIYIGSGNGNLFCINKNDGTIVWEKSLVKDFMGDLPMHGHSEAALVDGDKVYWTPGGKTNNIVALNRFTGELIWSNKGMEERSAYNSPSLLELENDRKIVTTFSAYHFMGFDSENGELLWVHEQTNVPDSAKRLGMGDTHANILNFENPYIYYVEGDGNCAVKLEISEDGSAINEVWQNKDFDCYMGGIIKHGNYLYGSATAKRQIRSLNVESGEVSDSLMIGRGSLIMADSMMYYYTWRGQMHLLSFDEGNMTSVSSFKIKKGTKENFSHPVIYKGILYVRHGDVVLGYDIKNKEA